MGVIESVLNFALMLLLLTLEIVGIYVLRPDTQTVLLGLTFFDPDAKPDVTG